MSSFYPRGSAVCRVLGDGVLLAGGGRALLMQVAHPSVAAGVAEHSDFSRDPFRRLLRTLEASYTLLYGDVSAAERVTGQVRRVHDHVVGDGYRANDPELLMWVHATLIDTAFTVHRHLLRPIPEDVAEEVYLDARRMAELYGCPIESQPSSLADFRAYVDNMVATLEVSDTGRRLADSILHGSLGFPASLALPVVREITSGLLPPRLRQQFGLRWDHRRTRWGSTGARTARLVLPRVPIAVRQVPARMLSASA